MPANLATLRESFTKQDKKGDFLAKLVKFNVDHHLTAKDRLRILNFPLNSPHIRWQVLDNNGMPHATSYPCGTDEMVERAIGKALATDEARRQGANAKTCARCLGRMSELYFPPSIGACCQRASIHCRACIETHVNAMVGLRRVEDVSCLMCKSRIASEDIRALLTAKTFKK